MAGHAKAPAAVVNELPFVSRRSAVLGVRGMVACSQPLAAEVSRPSLRFALSVIRYPPHAPYQYEVAISVMQLCDCLHVIVI